jgi:hypothetical protein
MGSPSAVRFHIIDAAGVDARVGQRRAQNIGLRGQIGRHQATAGAILIDRRATQHGEHRPRLSFGLRKRHQHQHAAAFAPYDAVGGGVECLAAAVGGEQIRAAGGFADLMRHHQIHPAHDRQRTFTAAQGLDRQMHGRQRRRTGGVDRQRRAAQPERIGQSAGDEIQRVSGDVIRVDRHFALALLQPRCIVARGGADEDAGFGLAKPLRRDARILQRMPGAFERPALLRIQTVRFARRNSEKFGIETRDVGQ